MKTSNHFKIAAGEVPFLAPGVAASVSVICFRPGASQSILVSERTGTKDLRSLWQTPGGGMNVGEPPLVAAMRELREETGMQVTRNQMKFLDRSLVMKHIPHPVPYHVYFFLCALRECDIPRNTEPEKHGPWEMASFDDLMVRPCVPGMQAVVSRLQLTQETML